MATCIEEHGKSQQYSVLKDLCYW